MSRTGALRASAGVRGWSALAATVVVSTCAGGALLEYLSRPRADDSALGSRDESAFLGDAATGASSESPASAKQLVAETKQVAGDLVARFPGNAGALTLGGSIFYALGDESAAERCWRKCAQIAPNFVPMWHMRGEAAWEQGEYDEAIFCLRRALDIDPGLSPVLAYLLADSLMSSGRVEEAIEALEKAADRAPLSADSLFLLGHAYLQTEQYEAARERLEAALAIDSCSTKALFGLSTAYARLGMTEEARKCRQKCLELKSKTLEERTRGRPTLRSQDLGDVRPLAVNSYLNAGKIYAVHGNVELAEEHWLRAAAVDPRHPEPRKWLQALYAEQGREDEARNVQQGGNVFPQGSRRR